jgi:ATP-binding cassette, sub-family E, member 1
MRKRIAVIDREKCHPSECGNHLCIKLCPVNRTGADCIVPGDDTKARIDEILCTGCGICPTRCPFDAIQIINLPESLNKEPIHRYGENLFELYSLPTPMPLKVTGILGKNGIGKSTALKVMAGVLKPNLGDWKKEAEFKEIINYFKGTQTQKFLQNLSKGKVTLSYKPQQVDLIPESFKGTVRELLNQVDKNNKIEKIIKELNITHFVDNDIAKISGGELQRVAIAACVLKDANLFLFDEPSSYLDIRQRINISKFIGTLASDTTSSMVIEHDLVILDYMTDLINIMYGHEGAYGIVSGVKSSREGINAFLEGFLREENVRFRDRAIKYENAQDKSPSIHTQISWPKLKVKLGNFILEAHEGELKKNEVIGILGENGIGKTSFIKILAGIIKPDEGALDTDVKVAYKPQYLNTKSDMLVVDFLAKAITNYERQLIVPLNISKLFGQKLSHLSGGQLQRVVIAHCLSQEADLFLLDEPSAYLDVEQRLLISKIIKNIVHERDITIMVVDHDLMFLDYISDRLAVFRGTPAQNGKLEGPFSMKEGMNLFLKELDITLRRDVTSRRPRINKKDSVKDREQRIANKFYYD